MHPGSIVAQRAAGNAALEATLVAATEPVSAGLHAQFGCGAADAPDVVVCDASTLGCLAFGLEVHAAVAANAPHPLQAGATFATFDATAAPAPGPVFWPALTREGLVHAAEVQASLAPEGVVARGWQRAKAALFHAGVLPGCGAAAPQGPLCWSTGAMPPVVAAALEAHPLLLLHNAVVPELGRWQPAHVVLTGPVLAPGRATR